LKFFKKQFVIVLTRFFFLARYDRPHFRVPLHPRKVLKINKAVVSSVFGDLQLVPLFIRLTLHYRNSLVIKFFSFSFLFSFSFDKSKKKITIK